MTKEKLSKEFLEREIAEAQRQMARFQAVSEYCRWLIDNFDWGEKMEEVNVEAKPNV